jgi:putative ABC transport system permease protein
MMALRLALRNVVLGHPRARAAMLLIAASLCVLDLCAGRLASERARLEYQAVVGERLGHLAITKAASGSGPRFFDAAEATRIRRIAEGVREVALVVPQIHLAGVASSGERAAVFNGAGVEPLRAGAPDVAADQPGRLQPGLPNGIAVSKGQAQSLGLRNGSAITLTGIAADSPPVPLNAQVVDIFSTNGLGPGARSVLMPLDMAQSLLDTRSIERLAVFLSDPRKLDVRQAALADALRQAGLQAEVHSWRQLSHGYAQAEWAASLRFRCIGAAVLALVAATLGATLAIGAFERRGQVAILRALGMGRRTVFTMIAAESLWISSLAGALGLAGSGLLAWVANRVVLSYAAQPNLARPQVLLELDFGRILLGLCSVLAVALLAALLAGWKAARAGVARGLRGDPGHPGW